MTDFNNDALWRYDIPSGTFTRFDVSEPSDVVVDAAGIVWFAAPTDSAIGRLDPLTGAVTSDADQPFVPRQLAIAADGQIWFTARFTPQGVGRPSHGIEPLDRSATAASTAWSSRCASGTGRSRSPGHRRRADGSVWFTQETKGNIARITNDGTITEGKVVKGSAPFGITVQPDGDPWYTMFSADKVAELQLR